MRIFTPDEELPFAGHPTLGTAFVLVSDEIVRADSVQTTDAGKVSVSVLLTEGFAWMQQLPPSFGLVFDEPALVASATGLEPNDLVAGLSIELVSRATGTAG